MSEDKIVFVGRMQNKTRDYIYNLKKENRDLQQENQQLKEQLEKKYKEVGTLTNEILYEENTKLLSVLDEIREYINTTEVSDDIGGILTLKECMYFDEILQILDKVKE